MIYLDNAATTPMDPDVIEAMGKIMSNFYGNPSAIYSVGRESHKLLNKARGDIALSIGANEADIFFTSGGTEGDNAIIDIVRNIGTKGKSNIVVSSIEHHAILEPAKRINKEGYEVRILPVDNDGFVSAEELRNSVDDKTVLVSIMMANNEVGTIEPIREYCDIAKSINPSVLFHTDAVQAVGHIEIDVKKLNIDYLSASAHKFNGPKGVGFLYVKEGAPLPSFVLGGGQENGVRAGTENVPGIVGMSIALKGNVELLHENIEKISTLASYFLEKLDNRQICYSLNGSASERLPGNINISIDGVDGEGLLHYLDIKGICVSTGSACNSKNKERSHVLSAMGFSDKRIDEAIRITLGNRNNQEEIDMVVGAIEKFLNVAL